MLTDSEKALKLFKIVNGELSPSCTYKVVYDEEDTIDHIAVIKDSTVCWTVSIAQLTFEYITRNF